MLRIRELRDAAGLSQDKLARLADLSVDVVRRAERGLGVSAESLPKLAGALGCSIDDLFATDGKRKARAS